MLRNLLKINYGDSKNLWLDSLKISSSTIKKPIII